MVQSRSEDAQPIYNRLPEESSAWFAKYLLYRNMKPIERSVLGAYNIYQSQVTKGHNKPYKCVPGAWKDACEKYRWHERTEAYDTHLQAEQEVREAQLRDIEAAEIERIMTQGYATVHRRIEALSAMADLIKVSFMDEDDKKINFAWVTPDKIREFRGCMDDIAKELGQRVKKQEITGKDGGAIEVKRNPDLSKLNDEELDTLNRLILLAEERNDAA